MIEILPLAIVGHFEPGPTVILPLVIGSPH